MWAVAKVENLTVTFRPADLAIRAIRRVSLEIRRGEILGLIGESGSGQPQRHLRPAEESPQGANTGLSRTAGSRRTAGSSTVQHRARAGRAGRHFLAVAASLVAVAAGDECGALCPGRGVPSWTVLPQLGRPAASAWRVVTVEPSTRWQADGPGGLGRDCSASLCRKSSYSGGNGDSWKWRMICPLWLRCVTVRTLRVQGSSWPLRSGSGSLPGQGRSVRLALPDNRIRVRRAMIIMASASGTPVPTITQLVTADEDTEARQARRIDPLRREH